MPHLLVNERELGMLKSQRLLGKEVSTVPTTPVSTGVLDPTIKTYDRAGSTVLVTGPDGDGNFRVSCDRQTLPFIETSFQRARECVRIEDLCTIIQTRLK